MARIPIVDEEDNVIGYKERGEIQQEDIYRVTSLWPINSKGEVLFARRALSKAHDPGKWASAVAGTVEDGEDYNSNIVKEVEEEIGVTGLTIELWFKIRITGVHNYFCQVYRAQLDLSIESLKLKADEVMEARWFTIDELKHLVETQPDMFVRSFKQYFSRLFKKD